jgi:hypothetical protein
MLLRPCPPTGLPFLVFTLGGLKPLSVETELIVRIKIPPGGQTGVVKDVIVSSIK